MLLPWQSLLPKCLYSVADGPPLLQDVLGSPSIAFGAAAFEEGGEAVAVADADRASRGGEGPAALR